MVNFKASSSRSLLSRLLGSAACLALLLCAGVAIVAQETRGPITKEELLVVLRQLPKRPALKEQLIEDLRRRGINFRVDSGLRSFVATKSGNDPDLRRTLEEAERRFLNPEATPTLPPAAEGLALLDRTRAATLEAAEVMPDFVVRQLVTRAVAFGNTRNYRTADRLTVAVSYRAQGGEQYRMLALNGTPVGSGEPQARSDYADAGGSTSTGEFVSALALLFGEEAKAEFKLLDTDTLRGRPTLVFEYEVKQPNSKQTISFDSKVSAPRSVVVGYRGRIWVDRERNRVLRLENVSTEIPADFPITAASRVVDYEWIDIPGQGEHLLPTRAVVELSVVDRSQAYQTRNDIRFRGYQKYGTEVKIIEEDFEEEPAALPSKP